MHRGVDEDKIYVVPNGANLDLFASRPENEPLVEELGLKEKFVAGYLGTHGLAHNLDFILDCAASLEDPDIEFLFIGDGAEKQNLKQQAKRLALDNVTFLDPIPKEEVPDYLSIFDIALVPLKKSDIFKTVIPSKIFESAAMGIPILLGVEGQAKEIVTEFNAGLCYEPENASDFTKNLKELKNNSSLYQNISQNSLTLAKEYDRHKLAKLMLKKITDIEF